MLQQALSSDNLRIKTASIFLTFSHTWTEIVKKTEKHNVSARTSHSSPWHMWILGMIWGFHCSVNEMWTLLGFYTMWNGSSLLKLRNNLSVSLVPTLYGSNSSNTANVLLFAQQSPEVFHDNHLRLNLVNRFWQFPNSTYTPGVGVTVFGLGSDPLPLLLVEARLVELSRTTLGITSPTLSLSVSSSACICYKNVGTD